MSRYQELISTGIVLTIVTGGVAGAITGYALNEVVAKRAVLAVAAALVAVLVARAVRHFTIFAAIRGAGPGPGTSLIPGVVLRNALVASVMGGLGCLQPRLQCPRSATRGVDRLPRRRDRGRVLRTFDDWLPSDAR